jgi:glycosyltransferase involved in cell wall biosynthesis
MNKNSILILRSNPVNPDPRVEKTARALGFSGKRVQILCWDRAGDSQPEEKKEHYFIKRIHIASGFGVGVRGLFPYLKWQIFLLIWLFEKRNQYEIIHACDFDTGFVALIAKIFLKKSLVYDIFDFYCDSFAVPELLKSTIRYLEILVINASDLLILVDENRRRQINGSKPRNIIIVYNSPEKQKFEAKEENFLFRIAYAGVFMEGRFIKEMISMVKEKSEWILEIAGYGGLDISEDILDSKNIKFHGKVSYLKALEISRKADCLFAIYDPSNKNNQFSSANKLFEAMMFGVPILVARGTGMDKIVENFNLGKVVEYDNKDSVVTAMKDISKWTFEQRKAFRKHANDVYENYFSWDLMQKRLLEGYKKLS